MKTVIGLMAVAFTLVHLFANAQEDKFSAARSKIENMGLEVEAITEAPVDGLYQVTSNRGLFYASSDGKYLLQARIFNLDEGMRNETEVAMSEMRLEGVERFSDSVIEFKAKNEQYVVYIFTDTTCVYCRKLHNEIDKYNEAGITVRYLAFPRAGLNTENHQDMVSVWCAENPRKALTKAKAGETVEPQTCQNEVAEHFMLGQKLGVTGTPAIIFPSGMLAPGYQPVEILTQALNKGK